MRLDLSCSLAVCLSLVFTFPLAQVSQDPDTGELGFKLALNTTLRPPSPMIRVTVDGEDILTTLGHPMWVSEKRWRMASYWKRAINCTACPAY